MRCALFRIDQHGDGSYAAIAFIADAELVQNKDGSCSARLRSGDWAGQEPNQYGVRHPDQPGSQEPGVYQRFTVVAGTATFVTRPQDQPMVYLIGQGQAY